MTLNSETKHLEAPALQTPETMNVADARPPPYGYGPSGCPDHAEEPLHRPSNYALQDLHIDHI